MYLNFIYKISDSLLNLAKKEIVDFPIDGQLNGWIDKFDIINKQLKHCSMYLVCELATPNNINVLSNPMCIVAKNQSKAMEIFNIVTEKNGTVMCEIINSCVNIKVQPTGIEI